MSNEEEQPTEPQQDPEDEEEQQLQQLTVSQQQYPDSDSDSDYSSSSSDDYIEESDSETLTYTRPGDALPETENTPEANIRKYNRVLESKRFKRIQEEEDQDYIYYEDLWDFPEDPENWREEDLKEYWVDAPLEMTKPGWDPVWADEEDWEIVRDEIKAGRDPGIAPFYVPYRKPYPAIPDNHYDISNPKAVIEELDRIEEFLNWVSYIFPDGSSYEGTVWDDLAHGKGVYVAEQGLVRYEGEWLQNNMEGHGVVEVDIPDIEPVPDSKLEAKMRAEGKIISRDFMSSEDREWLEMDVEDSIRLAGGQYEIPFYESDEWVKHFGRKPEKGRYRYAGQWKHGRMHGCGVYEVNERTIYGRFYFGDLLEDANGCDENISAMHAGIAEVAAAKARMFVNKPDGMVREERGPYGDPQHPYFYEEDDVWMAPGFINQFYEVPDYWKTYVHEVDQEREMWLNSFYKAPLRLPMPAELEYWWSKDETPEFLLINKEPEPDPEDPSKLIYTEDPLILHTPTGRLINYVEDEKHGVRLFWQPPLKEGEDVDPEKAQFLPLGFDEFYGREVIVKGDNIWKRFITAIENALKPGFDKLEKWTEEKKKAGDMKMKLIEKELDLIEAELCLEEAIEDMDEELRMKEKEEQKKVEMGMQEEEDTSVVANQGKKAITKEEVDEDVEEDDEEEEDDDDAPSSFGSVAADRGPIKNDQKGKKPRESPFSSSSLSFASSSLVSAVPSMLQQSILSLKQCRLPLKPHPPSSVENPNDLLKTIDSVSFPPVLPHKGSLRAFNQAHQKVQPQKCSNGRMSQLHSLCKILKCPSATANTRSNPKKPRKHNSFGPRAALEECSDSILSLHIPVYYLESYTDTKWCRASL
ncbi:PREDICTED: protein TIC 100 [Theobroma cacao]|uniref:Protein TIC 100 n=1 Tax=Theobroma cacao TaxID=3641 RepID=A0AB32WYQ5_THECC|nr:PREDICTED: protein TIC 100 [Theobroma cacao]XP_017983536.1 PREDICTED: protein TIC 100 [Theobroma cacao]